MSDDITLQILDTREADSTRSAATAGDQHKDAINAISFNPASETVVATGSADKTIGIWDLRHLKTKVHALECHQDSVTSLSWHPFEEAVLASASYDRRIVFWDLSRAGEEQTPDDAQDGPPELYVDPICLVFFCLPLGFVISYANPSFVTGCLCMVDTPTAFQTSAGILMILGLCVQQLKITYSKYGRFLMHSWAKIWRISRLRNWSLDIL